MSQKEYGKPSKLRREKEKAKRDKPSGPPQGTSDSHPTMETHPGARVPDPETGKKPAPVKKPRAKKPKPDAAGPVPAATPDQDVVHVSSGDDVSTAEGN